MSISLSTKAAVGVKNLPGNLQRMVFFCFFLSGMTGLIYEMVWTRWLVLIFGSTTFAISTVLTVFMAGLGFGSFLFGRMMIRRKNPLLIYAILEAAIGGYALLLPFFLPIIESLYGLIWTSFNLQFYTFSLVRFFLMALALIIPTTLMGATLPVLGHFMSGNVKGAGYTLGFLYFLNTSGAILGCFAGGFILLPLIGLFKTTLFAVVVNFLIMVGILIIIRSSNEGDAEKDGESSLQSEGCTIGALDDFKPQFLPSSPISQGLAEEEKAKREISPSKGKMAVILSSFALSGFAAMVYEVAWSRALSLVLGSSVYAFSAMLTTFLAGLALGSIVSASMVEHIKSRILFLAFIQLFAGGLAYLTLLGLGNLPNWMVHLYGYFFAEGSGGTPILFPLIQFLLSFSVMFLPTLLLGMMFPVVARIYRDRISGMSRIAGDTYSVNTFGAILGAFSGGFIFIPVFGIQTSLLMMIGLNLGCGLLLFGLSSQKGWGPRFALFFLIGTISAGFFFFPPLWNQKIMSSGVFWNLSQFHAQAKDLIKEQFYQALEDERELLFYQEGLTATVTVEKTPGNILSLKVNGRKESTSQTLRTQVLMAHLPMFMTDDPQEVLVIGFGSGVTVGSVSLHPVKDITTVELESAILEASRFFENMNNRPLDDPRVEVVVNDGRNFLLANPSSFDVIISQPSVPWISGASNLFTYEFFQLTAKRLNEEGVFGQWFSTDALGVEQYLSAFKSFTRVFPFVMVFEPVPGDILWIGSKKPLEFNYEKMQTSLSKKDIGEDLRRIDIDRVSDLLALYLGGEDSIKELVDGAMTNTDDNNYVEFFGPYYYFGKRGNEPAVNQILYPKLPLGVLQEMKTVAKTNSLETPQLLLDLSESSLKQWRLSYALSYANFALADKEHAKGHLLKGQILSRYLGFKQNRKNKEVLEKSALREYEQALLNDQVSIDIRIEVAHGLENLGDVKRAEEIFLILTRSNPNSAFFYTLLGHFYERRNSLDQAVHAYETALKLDSNQFTPTLRLSFLYKERGNFEKAEALLNQGIQRASPTQKPTALFHLAGFLSEFGRFEEGVQTYQKLLDLDSTHYLAQNNLGNVFQALGNMEAALQAYQAALRIQPDFFEAQFNIGVVSHRLGQLDKAYESYRRAIQLQPGDPSVYYHLGFLFEEKGNSKKAAVFFLRFIEMTKGKVMFAPRVQIAQTRLTNLLGEK